MRADPEMATGWYWYRGDAWLVKKGFGPKRIHQVLGWKEK